MLTSLLRHLERRVDRWAVESQQAARRNAMIASTALAKRRAEREDVDDFFAALLASGTHPAPEVRAVR